MLAERKVVDAALRLPFGQAAAQIVLEAGGGLIAVLGGLREQLHDDRRDRRRELPSAARRAPPAAWRCGSAPIPSDRTAVNGNAPVSIW